MYKAVLYIVVQAKPDVGTPQALPVSTDALKVIVIMEGGQGIAHACTPSRMLTTITEW